MLCTRPRLAVWVVLSVSLKTGSWSKQVCKHALRNRLSCKLAFLKKLTKSHREEERVGGFPLAALAENMSSEKVLQWRQLVGVIWSVWSSIILGAWFPVFTFCGDPYRRNPAVHGRDLLATLRKRHRQLHFTGKNDRIAQQRNTTDSSIWKEPKDYKEFCITGFWSLLHTQSHYFLLLTALTALNTWTIKTSWFPVIAGKVMSVGNLSLTPLKPSALPLRWPEDAEQFHDMTWSYSEQKKTLLSYKDFEKVYANSGSLTWLRKSVTCQDFRENLHFSVGNLVGIVDHHMVTVSSEQALPVTFLGLTENEFANTLSILSPTLNCWSKK